MSDLLHMTMTNGCEGNYWAFCRCGWGEYGFPTRAQARSAGDLHLGEYRQ